MNIYETHLDLLSQKKALDAKILDSQIALYSAHKGRMDEKDIGTINVMTPEERKRVDECLTTKPSKPSFKVEMVEG